MNTTWRADHIGSFLRPSRLLEARRNAEPESLRQIEDQEILRVLAKQQELGLGVATDGELRRKNFMSEFTDAVEGFDLRDSIGRAWQAGKSAGGSVSSVTGVVTSKLRQVRPLTAHELPFLKAKSPLPIKITLPSATQFPAIAFKAGITNRVYKDHSALLWEIVEIMKEDLGRLSSEGVAYLQIDAPRYSYYMDPKWRAWIKSELHVEPETALDEALQADNAVLRAARRNGVTLGVHLCRGNNRSHWYAEGGYDPVAEKLFGLLEADRFLLEYDDERSGTFEPLRFVPKGKKVVLGLISSKVPRMEDPEAIMWRIEEAARYVPIENLALSPQCGFASTAEGNVLTEEEQWAKLRLVVDTARRVWGES